MKRSYRQVASGIFFPSENFPVGMTFLHHGTHCLRHFLLFQRLQSTEVEQAKRGSETEAGDRVEGGGKVSGALLPFKS